MKSASGRPPVDLVRLPNMPRDELCELWQAYFGRTKPPQRRLLVRELAYRVQEQRVGGMDAATRKLLAAAMRALGREANATSEVDPASVPPASGGGVQPVDPIHSPVSKPRAGKRNSPKPWATPQLPAAARFVRVWHGRTYEVTVVENGKAFRFQNRTYRSLSQIATEITGTVWSGPKFFGLVNRYGELSAPRFRRRSKATDSGATE